MCGIAGAYGAGVGRSDRIAAGVDLAAQSIRHRGPDDRGSLRRDDVILAHERLSIIDLSECGHQPMCNETGDVWVIYNGEIYNYPELRDELSTSGHHLRSTSDTEVLIHGYEEWGIDGLLRRLRGMFAFALYDARPESPDGSRPGHFYLVRDRFGIKPLYYSTLPEGGVLFASEVRAIAASGLVDKHTEPRAATGFLLFGSVPTPLTTLRNVKALPPGHYLAFAPERRLVEWYATEQLFQPRPAPASRDGDIRALLDDTVRVHLLSDAPLGVFLSGGIDSSVLVALASRATPELRTVSIVFDEQGYSEKPYQDLMRRQFETRHHEVHVTPKEMEDSLSSFFDAMDQPTVDGLNTYFVARAARQAGLKVVLSGLGGDEVFGGYETLRRAPTMRRLQRLPTAVVRTASRVAPRRYARKLDYLADGRDLSFYLAQRGIFSPREVADLTGGDERDIWTLLHELSSPRAIRDARTLQQSLEFDHYLPEQLLRDADVFGMAHSLEIRVPFLDHVLAERVLSMPATSQHDPKWPKALLTKSTRDLVPPEIVFRRKQGFTFPFAPWLAAGRAGLATSLARNNGATSKTWSAFLDGREHWSRPWALNVLSRYTQLS